MPVQPITRELIVDAVALRRRFQISHWDAIFGNDTMTLVPVTVG